MTQTTYFSILIHAKQLSLMTLSDKTAGNGKNGSVTDGWTDGPMDAQTYGRTERREV